MWGSASSVPAPIVVTRCISAGSMPCSAASRKIGVTECIEHDRHPAGGGTGKPSEHVHGDVSEIRGPPPTDEYRVAYRPRTQACAATTAPKPTRLPTVRIGKTEESAPASILSRNAGKRLIVDDDDGQGRRRERNGNRPDAGHCPDRGPAPHFFGQERKIEPWEDDQRHRKFVTDDHNERQYGEHEGGLGCRCACHAEIQLDQNRRPLSPARELLVDDGRHLRTATIALAGPARGRFCTAEPPHADNQDDDRSDDAETRRREGALCRSTASEWRC